MTRDITKVDASERQEIANKNNKKNDTRREQTANDNEIITGYTVFYSDFSCRDYQYEVGKTFEHEDKIRLGSEGFCFFCKDPFDAFYFYQLVSAIDGLPAHVAKVRALKKDTITYYGDFGCAIPKISIDKEITLDTLIKEQIEKAYTSKDEAGLLIAAEKGSILSDSAPYTKIISDKEDTRISLTHSCSVAVANAYSAYLTSSGCNAKMFSIGGYTHISSSGDNAAIYSGGCGSSITSSGLCSILRIIGDKTCIASSGKRAVIDVEGNDTSIVSNGWNSYLRITGNGARITADGYGSQVTYTGKDGVITLLGENVTFKGSKGTLVSAVVYDKESKPIDLIMGRIGENGLKPDTLYTVENGEFVEVEA